MQPSRSLKPTVADALIPSGSLPLYARYILLALAGTLLLTLSAKLKVPFYPVPMTMQTAVVLLIGIALGARLGLATILLYLAEGAFGLPVFAGTPERGIGLAYMAGPTGGFLVGFAVAAWLAGTIVERRDDLAGLSLAAVLGTLAIFACGLTWLGGLIGAEKAIEFGLMPFVLGAIVKAALVVALGYAGVRAMRRKFAQS